MKIGINRRAGTGVLVLLVTTVLFTVSIVPSAIGAPPGEGSKGQWGSGKQGQRHHRTPLGVWRSQQAIEQLELTEEQVRQLRDADYSSREKRLVLKNERDQLQLQMDKAFSQDATDKKAIRQLAGKVADVQGKMFVEKTEDRLNLESILTSAQIQKLELNSRSQRRGKYGSGRPSYGRQQRGGGYGDRDCPRLR